MSLKDSLNFFIYSIPIQIHILTFFFFTFIYKVLGIDPEAKKAFFTRESLLSPLRRERACPYANANANVKANGQTVDLMEKEMHEHEYRKPGPGDVRSPCPALNTLANHGYIPRDGQNLTGTTLTHALMRAYNLSFPLAAFLAWGGVLLLGQVGKFSLHDLARHNRIEHDASLTHRNTREGEEYAPTSSESELFEALVDDARKGVFTHLDIARARIRREDIHLPYSELTGNVNGNVNGLAPGEAPPDLTPVQQEIARGEVSLVLQIFGGLSLAVPIEFIRVWWGEERLPWKEGWRPTRKTTLLGTMYWATQIRHAMQRMREGREKGEVVEEVEEKVGEVVETVKTATLKGKAKAKSVSLNGNINGSTNGELDPELDQMNRTKAQAQSTPYTPPTTTNGALDETAIYTHTSTSAPKREHSIPVAAAA